VDGNKRLGWLATAVFLALNGVDATVIPNDDVYRFVMDVAEGNHDIDELSRELRRLATRQR
jgi:death-on-curing protein